MFSHRPPAPWACRCKLGILYREDSRLSHELLDTVRREFGPSLALVGDYRIIGGGCNVL